MSEICCGYAEPIYEDDYSYCEFDEAGNPVTPPCPVVVALYCHLKGDYCNGYVPDICDKKKE